MKKTGNKIETAYCWHNGRIEFGNMVPDGAIVIARGNPQKLRDAICVCARLSYPSKRGGKDSVPLVPGIPEAKNDAQRLGALGRFIQEIAKRLNSADRPLGHPPLGSHADYAERRLLKALTPGSEWVFFASNDPQFNDPWAGLTIRIVRARVENCRPVLLAECTEPHLAQKTSKPMPAIREVSYGELW